MQVKQSQKVLFGDELNSSKPRHNITQHLPKKKKKIM